MTYCDWSQIGVLVVAAHPDEADMYAGGTAAEVKAQIIEERRREFFLEGRRFGDVIRYNLSVVPAPGTPFKNGGTYGPGTGIQICFPLPDVERNNNPNIPKTP